MNDRLTVSVVVPVHNASRYIEKCIRSLIQQSHPVHEIIVVDDASMDDSVDIVKGLIQHATSRIRLIERAENGGACAARAEGAKEATGDLLAFVDSDCVAPEDWVRNIVEEFQADGLLGGVGGAYSHPQAKSLIAAAAKYEEEFIHHIFLQHPLEAPLPGGNSAFKRDAWNGPRSHKEHIYFKGIASGEDVIICNEIRKSARVKFSNRLRVSHQGTGSGGYFRRHINRGISRATILLNRLSERGESNLTFRGYGGWKLFLASVFLGLAALSLGAVPFQPVISGLFLIGFLILHYLLSNEYFGFVCRKNVEVQDEIRLRGFRLLGLRGVMFLRSCCWVYGVLLACWRHVAFKAKVFWNVICSVLHFWRPGRISRLFYFVTAKCNARCAFCFNLENVVNWKQRKPSELTLEEVTRIAKNFKRLPYITLSGGEPFIREDLPQVIHAFWKHSKTQWLTIPTNAALTELTIASTIEILHRCPGLFLTVQVSLDSMHEDHDKSRVLPGGFVKLTKTLKALSELRKHYKNLRIQIATCYDDFNVARMDEIISYCKDNFEFDQQLFYLIRDVHTLITEGNNRLLPQYLDLLERNEQLEWKGHKQTLWARVVRTLQGLTYSDIARIKLKKEFLRPCYATQKFVTLYDDGSFSPCEVLEKVGIGNIREFDYDYYKLTKARRIKEFHKREIVDKKCNCDWMCATPMNMLYDPSTYMTILKGLINPDRLVHPGKLLDAPVAASTAAKSGAEIL